MAATPVSAVQMTVMPCYRSVRIEWLPGEEYAGVQQGVVREVDARSPVRHAGRRGECSQERWREATPFTLVAGRIGVEHSIARHASDK